MDGSRLWRAYLLGGLVAVGVFVLLPYGIFRDGFYASAGLAGAAVSFLAAARLRGTVGLAWALMGLGLVGTTGGDLLWLYYDHIAGVDPFPSPADIAYLLQYPFVTAALLMLARHRRTPGDRGALLDSTIVTVGLLLPYWVLLIDPNIGGHDSTFDQLVALAYPLADVVLLAGLVRLLSVSGARTPSFRLLTVAMIALLAGDVIFISTQGAEVSGLPLGDTPFLLSYVLWGAAALHPSARDLLDTSSGGVPFFTTRRLLTLMAVVLLAPGTMAAQLLAGFEVSSWPVTIASALLFVLVVARMADLLHRLQEQARMLDEVARTDTLTGLPNRRTLDAQLAREYERAEQDGTPLCLAMVDLDRFKLFNDTYGHQAGDLLLTDAATAWSLALGGQDMLARYGGEEFVLVMPGREPADAERLLAAMRAATPQAQTFSAGLALWDGRERPSDLLHRADLALYAAKEAGRDRVVRASRPAPPAGAHPAPPSPART
ncbi:diguanylate cyclase [Planomonospora sp. ID82291]|uniref:GGDEF domain-containing protein n=1 Tax=Planomonospora sp. ID82291 TaxID=2738136 RepID=UPI0018C37D54|nr:GGDEF domain-containing protein [Planomonospora sp. ID82291]MBG0817082.1 GGDEF domain-containing protein [Planomonospora sp. ID82291]